MSGQQNIFTIHETQLNSANDNGAGSAANTATGGNGSAQQQRTSQSDILIDTSGIPLTQTMPPMQHHHHQHSLQPTIVSSGQQQQAFDTISSQPMQQAAGAAAGSAKVAPEAQNVVYSVHPVFSLLEQHDALLVRQRAHPSATCCGFESANTYTVRARDGTPILRAVEDSNCCERCCFETNREYSLSLVHGDETVARIRKAYRVSRLCCYTNAARIESPEDNPIGHIKQQFTLFGHAKYAIYDCQLPAGKPSFLLESTSCRFCCTPLLCTCVCPNRQFRFVSTESGEQVASIARSWSPLELQQQQQQDDDQANAADSQQAELPAANDDQCQMFGIEFEQQLEARQKVLLLSACFMMDFFYFENDRRRRKLERC